MTHDLITQGIPFLATAIAFGYGLWCFARKGPALYFQLLTFAVGCFMMGKLFCVLSLLSMGRLPYPFHMGYLGYLGCFAFLFSANYGQLDSIIDDGGNEIKKARMAGFLAPSILAVLLIILFLSDMEVINKGLLLIISLPALPGSYFNLKHLIAPDFDFVFLKVIRPCNVPILLIYLLSMTSLFFELNGFVLLADIGSILVSLSFITLIILAARGHNKWKI